MDFVFEPVEDLVKVPEPFRQFYATEAGDDGKFGINPNFKGAADAIVGLNKSLKAARAGARNFDFSPLAEFGTTPQEVRSNIEDKLKELQTQLASKGNIDPDKIREELARGFSKKEEGLVNTLNSLKGQLYQATVVSAAVGALAKHEAIDAELVLPYITKVTDNKEVAGKLMPVVLDAQGDIRYSGITGQPMSIEELVVEMKNNPKLAPLFKSPQQNPGGGAPPQGGSKVPPKPGETKTAQQKIADGLAARRKTK